MLRFVVSSITSFTTRVGVRNSIGYWNSSSPTLSTYMSPRFCHLAQKVVTCVIRAIRSHRVVNRPFCRRLADSRTMGHFLQIRASRQIFWAPQCSFPYWRPVWTASALDRLQRCRPAPNTLGRPSIVPPIIVHEYCALLVFPNCSTATFYFASRNDGLM